MTLETVTLKLPRKLLSDVGTVAAGQDVTIGHLVRVLLAREVERRINPKMPHQADEGLIAALKTLLARDMAEADGWDDLAVRLHAHGYELRPDGGGIALHKRPCGTRVCTGSALGFAYRTLVQRFGTGMPGHPQGVLDIETRDAAVTPPLNSTLKGRLQRMLEPVFKTSTDWDMLFGRLHRRGFVLRPMGTGCAIYTVEGGRHVCNTATVGYRYRALVKKFDAAMPGHRHGADWVMGAAKPAGQPKADEPDFDVIDRNWRQQASQTQSAPT